MADSDPSDTPTTGNEVVSSGIPSSTDALEEACTSADDKSEVTTPLPQMPRENLIATAVNFLENPRVQGSPLSQKRAFLLKKGLTAEEIDEAIERARIGKPNTVAQHGLVPYPSSPPQLPPPPPPHLLQPEYSIWSHLSHVSSSIVIVGVASYGAYYMYKRYIEPYLRGWDGPRSKPDRLSQVQEQIGALTEAIQQLREAVASLESAVAEDRRLRKPAALDSAKQDRTISELKSEVLSVKALLLSRNQFPSAPKVTPPVPSIPTWQLSSNGAEKAENGAASESSESEESEEQSSKSAKEPMESRKEEVLHNRPTGLA
ncbi:peroxisomal membrane protein PEX14 isoform X2 [Rhipicephalus sanguineus]|uniref:peroxisomal membrane protein PEX14 isoform X2 n=1 Tax=Rhipicephalus sanguineus TaxID=34632 RepID=UPI0018955EEE|nr:peroxisomal membrane protein PEX14 isoform X2 [Rhipicephalus sanguineus]